MLNEAQKACAINDKWIAIIADALSNDVMPEDPGVCDYCLGVGDDVGSQAKWKKCPACKFKTPCWDYHKAWRDQRKGDITIEEAQALMVAVRDAITQIYEENYV